MRRPFYPLKGKRAGVRALLVCQASVEANELFASTTCTEALVRAGPTFGALGFGGPLRNR